MAETANFNKRWVLLGEYFDGKLDQGLSPCAAEHEIRREFFQRQVPYRLHDEYGQRVDPPSIIWSSAAFDFKSSRVTAQLPPDPLAPMAARILRQIDRDRRAALRLFGSSDADPEKCVGPAPQRVLRYIVEVEVEIAPLADDNAPAEPEQTYRPVSSEKVICDEIAAVYAEAQKEGRRPPNIKELVPLVQGRLEAKGLTATGICIRQFGELPKYKALRCKVGCRWNRRKSRNVT